jgi:PAS domain S-box-containing protein
MLSELGDLRSAIENDEIDACFQPLVGLQSGRLMGFEVLARWRHPEAGLVLPANFISLAEENGLIGELGRLVFRKAFAAAALISDPLSLSVNVSPVQLRDLSLVKSIRDQAEAAGFPLRQVVLEITEGAMLTDLECARTVANELTAMGCRLALDDFGTGYSSLAQLQALPFSELKVDRSFVSEMIKSRESRKIVASIIGLGHSLGLVTVAEGVETEEQAEMLLWLGCEQGQGWLYGKAMSREKIAEVIAAPPRSMPPSMMGLGEGWASSSLEALPAQRLAQLQAIYDGAPVGLCFLDRNLRYISLNQRLADMNGIPLVEHIGKTVAEVHPDLFPRIEEYLLRVLEGEAIPETDIKVPSGRAEDSRENRERHLRVTFYPAFDEADEVIGISVAVLDVSDDTTAERPPDAGSEHHPGFVPSAGEAQWIPGSGSQNIGPMQASADWVRTLEAVKAHARNLGWLEALHPDDLETTIRTLKASLTSGAPVEIEYRVGDLHADNPRLEDKWKWLRSRGIPRLGSEGQILGWRGTVEEIHDLKMKADGAMGSKPRDEGTA